MATTATDGMSEFFGEPIFIYTRAQAIADGMLVDVTEIARKHGYKCDTALTRAVFSQFVEVDPFIDNDPTHEAIRRVLRAIHKQAIDNAKAGKEDNMILATLTEDGSGLPTGELKAIIEAAESGASGGQITILLPNED